MIFKEHFVKRVFFTALLIITIWPIFVSAGGMDELDYLLLDDDEKALLPKTYTNQFNDIDIRAVLNHLSYVTGVKIVADSTSRGWCLATFKMRRSKMCCGLFSQQAIIHSGLCQKGIIW